MNIAFIMLERFKTVKRFTEKWQKKTPKQKWLTIYSVPAKSCEFLGIRVFTDSKVYWFSYMPLALGLIHFPTVIYTLWTYHQRGELLKAMQCLCTCGMLISIFAIYFQAIGPGRAKIKNVVNFGNINIYKDTNEPSKYHDLCEKMIKALIKDIIIVVLAIIISYWTFGAGTLYAIFFQGARVTFLSTELPFFDINTTSGYAINFIQQSSTTIVGIIANISIEICGCLAYNAIETVPDLFHLESEELAKELKLNGMSLSAKLRVRNILMQAQDLNMAVMEAVEMYYIRLLLGPFLFVLSISFSIFSQMILGYPSGYGCAMCNYILLIIFCYLGENLKQANEKVALELYCMPWYSLSPSCQKGIISGIHWMQNGPAFTIGPFAELNFETASDLTKTIYRFTMLLLKMFL